MLKRALASVLLVFLVWGVSLAQSDDPLTRIGRILDTEYPVRLGNDVVFSIKTQIKAFSPAERAHNIGRRLLLIAMNPLANPADIRVVSTDISDDIVFRDETILLVLDIDARAAGMERLALANQIAEKMRVAVARYQKEHSLRTILLGVAYSVAGLMAVIVVIWIEARYLRKLLAIIRATPRIRALRVGAVEVVAEERVRDIFSALARGARLVIVVGVVYTYIHLALSTFPWTRPYADQVLEILLTPLAIMGEAFLRHLPGLFFIVILVLVTRYILKFMRFLFMGVERGTVSIPGFYTDWAQPTYKIVRFLVIAFTAVVAFPYIPGSDSEAFKGVSIFLGVLFSLGSTSAISNMVAGIMLTYMRSFKVGDIVKIDETLGRVFDVTLLVTRIRTPKNVEVSIPNSAILGKQIVNYSFHSKDKGLILHTSVTIGYGTPWRQIHKLLIAAALRTENVARDPAPFVLQTALNDFYVTYEVNAFIEKPREIPRTYSDIHQNIQDCFNEAGVEIMSPHFTQLRDGNRIAIPEDAIGKDYVEPAHRVTLVKGEKAAKPGE